MRGVWFGIQPGGRVDGKGACSNMEVKRGEDPFPLSPEGCDLRIFLSRAASAPLVTDREADGEPERAPCPAPQRGCGSPGSSGNWGLSWGSRGPGQASCCPTVSPPEREDEGGPLLGEALQAEVGDVMEGSRGSELGPRWARRVCRAAPSDRRSGSTSRKREEPREMSAGAS